MARLALIAALSRNRVIGRDGSLPWRLPDDSRHFRKTTLGKPVVMGRRTWESLSQPLARRDNVVLTRNPEYRANGATVLYDLNAALTRFAEHDEIIVAGGAHLYAEALPRADCLYLTLVDAQIEGDTFFPNFDRSDWVEIDSREHSSDDRHAYAFRMITYERAT